MVERLRSNGYYDIIGQYNCICRIDDIYLNGDICTIKYNHRFNNCQSLLLDLI